MLQPTGPWAIQPLPASETAPSRSLPLPPAPSRSFDHQAPAPAGGLLLLGCPQLFPASGPLPCCAHCLKPSPPATQGRLILIAQPRLINCHILISAFSNQPHLTTQFLCFESPYCISFSELVTSDSTCLHVYMFIICLPHRL